MNYFSLFLLVLTFYSACSEVCKESCDEGICTSVEKNKKNPLELLVFSSMIHKIVNISKEVGFEFDQCLKELMLIEKGFDNKDIWALKREYPLVFPKGIIE